MPTSPTPEEKVGRKPLVNGSYVHLPDHSDPRGGAMCWPNPEDPKEVEYRLRYGKPDRGDLLVAAAFMDAYRHLVMELPQTTRNLRVSELRAALQESEATVA